MGWPEIIAGVAALAAAGTGLGTYVLGTKRLKHERGLADLADARETLAAGAVALGQIKTTLRQAYGRFEAPLGNVEKQWPENTWDILDDVLDASEALETTVAALRIRFDKSDPVVAEAVLALEDVRALAALYRRAAGSVFGASRNRDELDDSEKGWNLNVSYDAHKEAYLEAAQRLAGAKL